MTSRVAVGSFEFCVNTNVDVDFVPVLLLWLLVDADFVEDGSEDCELDCREDEKNEEDKLPEWGLPLVWELLPLVAVEVDFMEERNDCDAEKKEEDKLFEWGLLRLLLLSL